ncbi:MAG: tripartite tricarboxylate transporter substrate binding protein [Burkholderiales bacterium]|nr:tripartite tricarboxylate transporter substrate binding protein [Burkholderiales bacterium]
MKRAGVLPLLALLAATPAAHPQTGKWPVKPVRTIVPFPPGGATDIVARMIAARLSEEFGQQFIVDNRAGAAGTIGAEVAARANADGYTVIVVGATYAASAALHKLPYDPVNGIAPIAMLAAGPNVLVVHPSLKAANLNEFIALARAKPGSLNFGSGGTGSFSHLAAELFRQMTRTDMVHVPFKGTGPALANVVSGQIQLMFAAAPAAIPQMKAGRLRALAVTTGKRSPVIPDLPAISEQVPGYAAAVWQGMWTAAGTPKEIVSRLNRALAGVLDRPDVRERLRTDGAEPAHSTPEEFARFIARDIARWSTVVKAGNIRID